MPEESVLIVEDEKNLLDTLKYNIEREGYKALTASDGEKALEIARSSKPNLVVLDVMLPKLSGIEICRILRKESDVPILMLTAKGEEIDRVVGLEMGADDYVVKPFSMRELMARVKSMLRRSHAKSEHAGEPSSGVTYSNNLEIDLKSHTVKLDGKPMDLKPREFDLMALLMSNKGIALTRNQILARIWGEGFIGDHRTVDVHMRWLREKIEKDPSDPKRIITIRGVGYRFEG